VVPGVGLERQRNWGCYRSFTPQLLSFFFSLKAGLAGDEISDQKSNELSALWKNTA